MGAPPIKMIAKPLSRVVSPARPLFGRESRLCGPLMIRFAAIFGLLPVLLAPEAARAAESFASDWAPTLKASARLVLGAGGEGGFEIKLAPGAITYWRDPGDSGEPPSFDFSLSSNVGSAEVEFPAPRRIVEADGSVAYGYDGDVILPIKFSAADAGKPVTLAVNATYAVCEKICVPARAKLSLSPPLAASSPYAAAISAALMRVPGRVAWSDLEATVTAVEGRGWRLCLPARRADVSDLFFEASPGWTFVTKLAPKSADGPCFAVALRDRPKDGAFPVAVTLTFAGPNGGSETAIAWPPSDR